MDSTLLLIFAAISTWASVVAAFGAVAAVRAAVRLARFQVDAAKSLTCLQLFLQLAAQYDSSDMQRARARLAAKLLANSETLEVEDTLLVFYENLGILVRRKLLDPELVWNTFSIDVQCYWPALEHYVNHCRYTKYNCDTIFEEFEELYKHFRDIKRSPLGTPVPQVPFTAEVMKQFLRDEERRSG